MKPLLIATALCILTLGVESQLYPGQNQQSHAATWASSVYPKNINLYFNKTVSNVSPLQLGSNSQIERVKVTERDSYLQAISRSDNTAHQQLGNVNNDGKIHFVEPLEELRPPPFTENANQNYYSTQQNNDVVPRPSSEQGNVVNTQQMSTTTTDKSTLNDVNTAISNFGLRLLKSASQLQSGNVIVSPTSIAIVLALLQQGATGDTQKQIADSLQMSANVSESTFSAITTNIRKRNSHNLLSIANNIFVSDSFELNNAFKSLAIRSFWSDVTPTSFGTPSDAIQKINSWVAAKTHNKIENLLTPDAVSTATQLVLVNAVYFKGVWETKFKPERTETKAFHLNSGATKNVPFMHTRSAFQVGYDLNTQALVTILPFESHQYSLILILPRKTDNVANVLSSLTAEQFLYYQTFKKLEIAVEIPKFTLKTDTDLNPVLRSMGLNKIFGAKSDLSGIGLYRNLSPQISHAVHSGYLSVDEQGVTAAAATAFAAVALSFDDSSITFKADRPFIAVLWDNQFSIPLFMAKIEDPS